MLAAHGVMHVPVPSTSGQAVLTLPLLVPLSDLIGLSRQVTVLAYQYGALMAMLAACGVPYEGWVRFAAPTLGFWWSWRPRRSAPRSSRESEAQAFAVVRLGTSFSRSAACTAPTCRRTSRPWSKTMRVGIPRIPKRAGVA